MLFVSNAGQGGYDQDFYFGDSNNESVETYAKGYGGRGFTVSPKVLEFKRGLVCEYELE